MMIIYGTLSAEVLESVEDSSHGAETWEKRGQMVVPHIPLTPHPQEQKIDFLSLFSPTESSDEEWGFA